jgi:hypothetical protein
MLFLRLPIRRSCYSSHLSMRSNGIGSPVDGKGPSPEAKVMKVVWRLHSLAVVCSSGKNSPGDLHAALPKIENTSPLQNVGDLC